MSARTQAREPCPAKPTQLDASSGLFAAIAQVRLCSDEAGVQRLDLIFDVDMSCEDDGLELALRSFVAEEWVAL
jgi:hypothetical protein